jgi:cold shock CspA family protein
MARRVDGTVVAFDVERGLGIVADEHGEQLPFHCTAIGEGSRVIDVGARVRYRVVGGPLGRWEGSELEVARHGG